MTMDYTAQGLTTNLAARMQQATDPGSILVAAPTWRLAEGYFRFRPVGPLRVRGAAELIEAYLSKVKGRSSPGSKTLMAFFDIPCDSPIHSSLLKLLLEPLRLRSHLPPERFARGPLALLDQQRNDAVGVADVDDIGPEPPPPAVNRRPVHEFRLRGIVEPKEVCAGHLSERLPGRTCRGHRQ